MQLARYRCAASPRIYAGDRLLTKLVAAELAHFARGTPLNAAPAADARWARCVEFSRSSSGGGASGRTVAGVVARAAALASRSRRRRRRPRRSGRTARPCAAARRSTSSDSARASGRRVVAEAVGAVAPLVARHLAHVVGARHKLGLRLRRLQQNRARRLRPRRRRPARRRAGSSRRRGMSRHSYSGTSPTCSAHATNAAPASAALQQDRPRLLARVGRRRASAIL